MSLPIRHVVRLTTAFLIICCALAAAPAAGAKALRLQGTKFTYVDRSGYPSEVGEAVRMWNASGTPVRLRPAPRGKPATIVFVRKSRLSHGGQEVAGLGGIHFTKQRKPYGRVQLSASVLGQAGQVSRDNVDVVAHELGHAMGLGHSSQQCTLMYPVGGFIRSLCPPSPSDTFRCGPQREDAAALAKLYRGRLRWPANGGLCTLPAGWAAFLDPADGAAIPGGYTHVTVRNDSGRTWTDMSVALTFVDAAGQVTDGPCGGKMSMSPAETSVPPGEAAHFEVMPCGPVTQQQELRVRMTDTATDTVFGPVLTFTAV